MSLEIAPTTNEDRAECQRLLGQVYPHGEYPQLDLERMTTDAQLAVEKLVARQDGRAVGLAIVTFVDYGALAYGVLEELIVDVDQRGEGIGRTLGDAASTWVADRGGRLLYVDPASGQAEDYYRSLGFEPARRSQLCRVLNRPQMTVTPRTWN